MADVLYLKDGTAEVVIDGQVDTLRHLIETHLGRDCAHLLDRITNPDLDPVDGACLAEIDSYEADCDALRALCTETLESLDEIIKLLNNRPIDHYRVRQKILSTRTHLYNEM